MVTMAVITILISLLTPTLSGVRETANQVVCRSNIRQLGIGVGMFAEDHKDKIPQTLGGNNEPWETNTIRYGTSEGPLKSNRWDGLGHLYRDDYLPAPKLFYCPSHHGANPYVVHAPTWAQDTGLILANYQYRGSVPISIGTPGQPTTGQTRTVFLSQMSPGTALISDCMRTESDFNHEIGANLFRADMSTSWFSDREMVSLLPGEGELPTPAAFQTFWERLDER
jgi:hypothetical protein